MAPHSPSVALLPMTAQGVMPPPAVPVMLLTPPVSTSLPVSACARAGAQARPVSRVSDFQFIPIPLWLALFSAFTPISESIRR